MENETLEINKDFRPTSRTLPTSSPDNLRLTWSRPQGLPGLLAWSTIPISSTFLVHGKSNIQKTQEHQERNQFFEENVFSGKFALIVVVASINYISKPSKTLGKPSHVLKIDNMATGSFIASSFTFLLCTFQDSTKNLEMLTY